MNFFQLAQYFKNIEETTSRLKMTEILAELFKKLNSCEAQKTAYLIQGRVVPLYEKTEFGMAEKMIIKAICLALNLEKNYFEKTFKNTGDLGETVEKFKKEIHSFEEKELTILQVYEKLYQIATASGEGSQEVKLNILSTLIRQLDPLSAKYIVRIPAGVLRLGFSDMTVLDAFSWMIGKDKSLRKTIEKAYHVRPDLGYIAKVIKEEGVNGIKKIKPNVFTPILMMRAERLPTGKEIIEKIGKCAIENKYDGFRLQCHYKKLKEEEVSLYSRNLEDVTFMYPDIVAGIKKEIKAKEVILEGEAIGFNPASKEFLPFQETVQRKRKYEVEKMVKEIPLKIFIFELLYLDGESYLNKPFLQRREKLTTIIKSTGDVFKDTVMIASQTITENEREIELLFEKAISQGLEGIVAKKLDGIYQPGARGWNWIKFKRSYSSKIEDTIDCLVMGYDLGKGKRAGFGIGAFLVGIYDEKNDQYLTVAKIGTGLSDQEWKELRIKSTRFKIKKRPNNYLVDKMMVCDIWLLPSIVVEIKADEITRSPVHTAGRKMKLSKTGQAEEVDIPGFALRFPRLERFREDKRPEEITTLKEVEDLYQKQKR